MSHRYEISQYSDTKKQEVIAFYEKALVECGKRLDLEGKHKIFLDIAHNYDAFWCLYDEQKLIGTVAIRELEPGKCELKSLYLYESYQGEGLGYCLLCTAKEYAEAKGYRQMYLDTISTSKKAIHLYERAGFVRTKRYNENPTADVFMVMEL